MNIKKILAVAVILLFISVSVIPSTGTVLRQSSLPTFYDGKTLYVGGSGPGNYTKIQDAIDNASDGDTVFVFDNSSPYYENVEVDKSINLIGEDRNTTVIDGGGIGDVIYVSSDGVNISRFTIENGTDGIDIFSNYTTISGNNILNNEQHGTRIHYHCSNIINGNNICSNNWTGISVYGSGNITISGNNISNNGWGVHVYHIDGIIYHNNIINNTHNAYSWEGGRWNNSYPSCGNYWDDYSGVDNYWGSNQNIPGSDGVGDTPYNISGGSNQDLYPLMEPYGMTELEIIYFGQGLFKIPMTIINIGNTTAFNVQWKITIDGGIVVLGRNSSGIIKPLLPAEEVTVSSKFVLGFGQIIITVAVWADNAPYVSESTPGTLFLFFIMLK